MYALYTAHGLALCSSFALAGMSPAPARDLPSLALDTVTPDELDERWSRTDEPPLWRGLLGDGSDLTIERGHRRDLLFGYGARARFRLDPGMRTLECAPRRAGLDWQRALLTKVIPSISVMRGYEALHASAVDLPDGVLAIAAPSGTGKTTLAAELLHRGHALLSDDVLTLESQHGAVRAHPGTPHMNIAVGEDPVLEPIVVGDTLSLLEGESWVVADATASGPRPVQAVCLLERGERRELALEVLPTSPLPLAPYILGLPGDAERERRRFSLYADLVSSATLLRLSCGPSEPACLLADVIEDALQQRPSALAVGGVR